MADLGRAALVTAFLLLVYALVAGSLAAWQKRRRLAESAQNALLAAFGATLVASAVLLAALARHDFSFQYVADHTSHELPLGYTLTAFWGGQEGSLLLWLLVLTGYSVAAVLTGRRAGREVLAWVVPTLGLVGTFFAMLLVFVASPFATQATAADGAGLNPSLQNPYMAIHPPMLYLGYVGFTVPFSFAIASLVTGRFGEGWLAETRRATLVAWGFLTIGIILGAWWSYEVLGWGGYWAWDPVENASLLPWLTATAFIHSVIVQERRGMLRVWNLSLVIATFCLTILGTFLTRSGILNSVHSFTQSAIGTTLLVFLGLVAATGIGLIAWRGDRLRTPGRIDSPMSRESAFLANRAEWQYGDEVATARIRVSDRLGWQVERHYGRFGEIAPADDGGVVFTTPYANTRLLVAWILGLGEHARVEGPPELVAEVGERLAQLAERHDGGPELAAAVPPPAPDPEEAVTENGNGRRDPAAIRPERFARLVTLASILIDAGRVLVSGTVATNRARLDDPPMSSPSNRPWITRCA